MTTNQPERIQIKQTSIIYDDTFEGHLEEIIHTLREFQKKGWEGIDIVR